MKTLLFASVKKQKYTVFSILLLVSIMCTSIFLAVMVNRNASQYISSELERMKYGDETLWVSFEQRSESKQEVIDQLNDKRKTSKDTRSALTQKLVFAGYEIHGNHSDNEGQLVAYDATEFSYRFFNPTQDGYQEKVEIAPKTIYVSPGFASNFKAKIGDTITFRLSREGDVAKFRIAGYFEDPFMGSNMIDMKSFLINEDDYNEVNDKIQAIDSFQALARSGAMIHITSSQDGKVSDDAQYDQLRQILGTEFNIEFTYTRESIYGFMMILQNVITGFLSAFALILGMICILIIGHGITTAIAQDYRNLGILKTMGAMNRHLRIIILVPYGVGGFAGVLFGVLGAWLLSGQLQLQMVGATGIMIPTRFLVESVLPVLLMIGLFFLFMFMKTKKLAKISPMVAIREKETKVHFVYNETIKGKSFLFFYAVRQIVSHIKRYVGILVIACILAFLVFTVGKMNQWLGKNGEGLMNSFSVARHDIGVQPKREMNLIGIEEIIQEYAPIEETYELAMQSGTVNEEEYTINVLDEPDWFHILEGRTCTARDEVVITEYVAQSLGVNIGDTVRIRIGEREESFSIVGIYSCANEMGANVGLNKAGFERIGKSSGSIWCKHYILADSTYNDTIMKRLQKQYPMDIDVHTNSWSGLGSIVSTMKLLTISMYIIVCIIIIVSVVLTSTKLLQMEQKDIAILKSQGIPESKLRVSFALKLAIVSGIGTLLGICLASAIADKMVQQLLISFGISDFNASFSMLTNVGNPGMVLCLFLLIAYIYAGKIKRIDIAMLFYER